jgi:hypothetical protein
MKSNQTSDLLVLSKMIIAARDAAAPISKAMANVIASHSGFDNLKKSITWIVDIALTIKYRPTNMDITDHLIMLSLLLIL